MAQNQSNPKNAPKRTLLSKLTIFFFDRTLLTLLLWLLLIGFGILSYTTLLKREGFPSVNIPFAATSGTYYVNDAGRVDSEVAKPLAQIVLAQKDVKAV